jgi:hypothetical protein
VLLFLAMASKSGFVSLGGLLNFSHSFTDW